MIGGGLGHRRLGTRETKHNTPPMRDGVKARRLERG
jgi:hypothetical protein